MTQKWPPDLPDHVLLTPWRPLHPEDLALLLELAHMEPCQALGCEARSLETGKREIITAFHPLIATPAHVDDAPRERLEEVRRAMGAG